MIARQGITAAGGGANGSQFLRQTILADAALSGVAGLVSLVGARALAEPLGLSTDLLRGAGVFMLAYAAALMYLGQRTRLPRPVIRFIVAGNGFWALGTALLPLTGWIAPTALGTAVIVAQAAAVASLAILQGMGLQRSTAATG